MKEGVREPQLEAAFVKWTSEGREKYTLKIIHRWRKQAEAILNSRNSARALSSYWGIDKPLRPLEEDVGRAVFEYDERINADCTDAR